MSTSTKAPLAPAGAPVLAPARPLFGYRRFWAHRLGPAPFLPRTRDEMDALGWDECDIVLVTGDAYVDHPSFGMAIIGRLLEAQGFRVGILAQPDWRSPAAFEALGRPALFFGVTGGNMDSMVNRYTSERRPRSDDAYSPGAAPDLRPDRSVVVYAQRCRQAFRDVPVVIGGIEASLRRIAHYDYWSDEVRRSILVDSHADLLVFGNGERAVVELAHRLAAGTPIEEIRDLRGTAFVQRGPRAGMVELDSTSLDRPGPVAPPADPYVDTTASEAAREAGAACTTDTPPAELVQLRPRPAKVAVDREHQVIRLPAFEQVSADRVLYAHASRVLHLEANPGNARALVQRHGTLDVWLNPPPIPLTTAEMDALYELPYQRVPHPAYGGAKIPAYEMIRFSVTILRGCFGGCSFCSITEHEGRIIQNRSEASILREVEAIRDRTPGFTGVISDLGGPTANMWRLACKSREIEAACRKPSCVFPDVCENLGTDHGPLVALYRKARALPGVKRILIASGLRYDLAVRSPEYVRELAQHHTGGYLKIAPEHTEPGPLAHMMKPGIGTYGRFKELFDRYSAEAGKEQYLIPYFIAAHPGTTDLDMLNLALWLKANGFRPDAVQAFLPSPMASATAMYHTGYNPLRSLKAGERVETPKSRAQRRLHKAFLRYHDAENWPILREALTRMGRADLIGNGKHHLVPRWQPQGTGARPEGTRTPGRPAPPTARTPRAVQPGTALTQHTGLPPMPRAAG
ncbi:MAG TPA: YgiQ family radical SAM protein, partial [Kofleriaceae bacterium]|nr:YgiQ family radical SAM protein [Kofleriaceae bacterium]